MSELKPFELATVVLVDCLVLLSLVGLVVRRHLSSCWALGLYLLAVLVTDVLMFADANLWKSGLLYSRSFWLLKENFLNVLKFAIIFELVGRAFARFPGARATAHWVLRIMLVLTLVTLVWVAAGWPSGTTGTSGEVVAEVAGAFQPRIVTATTWLFVAVAALILWYRLPLESMPKAILIGFVPFLIFSYLVLELRNANRWPEHGWLMSLDSWAFVLVQAYWARSAWQPFREIIFDRRPVPAVQGSAG